MVREGLRADVRVAELCRCEGLRPTVYCDRLKDYMEAGKNGLRGDTSWENISDETEKARSEEVERLGEFVTGLRLQNVTLKKV